MVNRNFWGRNLNKCACDPDSECPICIDEEWDDIFIEEEYKEFQTLDSYDFLKKNDYSFLCVGKHLKNFNASLKK